MERYTWIATAAFGLEGVVAKELGRMELPAKAENGGAVFEGTLEDAFRANLWLRTADRILMQIAVFEARSFDALFEQTKALPWERWIRLHSRFPVTGNCARSQLMSVRDCQAIIKKAIVERMRERTHIAWLPEDQEVVQISFQIHQNRVRLTLDASGEALNRRGYRTWNGAAPMRETLAAALVTLSPFRPSLPLVDPMCGTGTLLIEAAMISSRKAPGLSRAFAMEQWKDMPSSFQDIRAQARAQFDPSRIAEIAGSDIDPEAIELAKRHVRAAGLEGFIHLEVKDAAQCDPAQTQGVFLTNPPYGERLGDQKSCEPLYRTLGTLSRRHPAWSFSLITSHPRFEHLFGRRATKKRRFYNGRLECEFMIFAPLQRPLQDTLDALNGA